MIEYRLLKVEKGSLFLDSWSNSELYICTYEIKIKRKKYVFFGEIIEKTYIEEKRITVPDFRISSWLKEMNTKVGIWRVHEKNRLGGKKAKKYSEIQDRSLEECPDKGMYKSESYHIDQNDEMPYPEILIPVRGSEVSSWKMYYELHKSLFLERNNYDDYLILIVPYRFILEDWMIKYNLSIIPAVILLCENNDDKRFKLSIISAAFLMIQNQYNMAIINNREILMGPFPSGV